MEADALEQRVRVVGRQLAALDGVGDGRLDVPAGALEDVGAGLEDADALARAGGGLGDARAHEAGAHDADGARWH